MSPSIPDLKCYFTTGPLLTQPSEIEKRRPYTTLHDHVFQHQVDLLLPRGVYEIIKQDLFNRIQNIQYHRIFMPLGGIFEKPFYTKYIRMGNIMMLSDGRIDVDDIFCLYDGILHLSVRKEMYEKAGLVGVTATFGGRGKDRWIIEFNLRESFMVHGRKAFDRLLWSCKNVFKTNQRWLFCDLNQKAVKNNSNYGESSAEAVEGLSVPALLRMSTPDIKTSASRFKIPALEPPVYPTETQVLLDEDLKKTAFLDWAMHVHEWIALADVFADRLPVEDNIDAYLSRYVVEQSSEVSLSSPNTTNGREITRVRWRGFLPGQWTRELFRTISTLTPENEWSAIAVHGFANAPVSWKGNQHSALAGGFGGENIITAMVLPLGSSKSVDKQASGKTKKKKSGGAKAKRDSDDAMEIDSGEGSRSAVAPRSEQIIDNSDNTPTPKRRFMMWEVVGSRDEHS